MHIREQIRINYLSSNALGGPRLLRSYKTVFTGFAARLTEGELKEVSRKPGLVRTFPNTIAYHQTTRTPGFLGLPNSMGESPDSWPGAGGRRVIVSVIDAGIDDGHPSMADTGFDDLVLPAWTGSCHPDVRCNKKLIGVKQIPAILAFVFGGREKQPQGLSTRQDLEWYVVHHITYFLWVRNNYWSGADLHGRARGL